MFTLKISFVAFIIALSTACQSMTPKDVPSDSSHAPYPESWWTPVPRDQAASWEILPQDAGPGEVILSKRNELGLLSNFAATPFTYRGVPYASVEGFWQMTKYPEGPNDERVKDPSVIWTYTREQVGQMTAFDAKHAGDLANQNMKKLGIQWVTFEGNKINYLENSTGDFYQLIYAVEMEKMKQNQTVHDVLVKTGTLILKPDHTQYPDEAPAWKYFDIWMDIRSKL